MILGNATRAYIGSTAISRIMLGAREIWQAIIAPSTTGSLPDVSYDADSGSRTIDAGALMEGSAGGAGPLQRAEPGSPSARQG